MIVQMFMLFNIVYGNYLNTDYQKIFAYIEKTYETEEQKNDR